MKTRAAVAALLLVPLFSAAQGSDASEAKRRQDREVLLKLLSRSRTPATGRMNRFDKTWEDWASRDGELPPDFETMP